MFFSEIGSYRYLLLTGLEAKPKLSELQKYVRPIAAERWEEVAIALGLADDDDGKQLDIIKEEKKGDSNQCFNELMKLWLRSGADVSPCTWATLIAAMRSVAGLESTGKQIEDQILTSSEPNKINEVDASHTSGIILLS